jgi:hypothetical protein
VPIGRATKASVLGLPNERFFPLSGTEPLEAEFAAAADRRRQALGLASDARHYPKCSFWQFLAGRKWRIRRRALRWAGRLAANRSAMNPQVQSFIRTLRAGQQVDVVYEEALAISVEPMR